MNMSFFASSRCALVIISCCAFACAPSDDGAANQLVNPILPPAADAGSDTGVGVVTRAPIMRGAPPTAATASAPGSFQVLNYTSGYRDGPNFADATIWYPGDAAPPFALAVVVPGFLSPQSSIATWGSFLASHGIATMTIGTNAPTETPPARANALLDALTSFIAENERGDSPLAGKLDVTRTALVGWSMGGGGTLLASSMRPQLSAAVTLAAWGSTSLAEDVVPTLLIASNPDELAQGMSQPSYESLPAATPKMLVEVQGGNHFIVTDPSNMSGLIGRYGLAWLKVYLEGDERYRALLLEMPMPASDYRTNLK